LITGTQPPFTHTPNKSGMLMNGSGEPQVAGSLFEPELLPDGGGIPGGNHPPSWQVPPPIVLKGSGVVQGAPALMLPPVEPANIGAGGEGEPLDGGDIPGGNQPPSWQVPPPIDANGSGMLQLSAGEGAPIVMQGGTQKPFWQVPPPIAANGSGASQGTGPPPIVMPGGTQKPFWQVPPPIGANGFGASQGTGPPPIVMPGGTQKPL
jgi:hypothetical protein